MEHLLDALLTVFIPAAAVLLAAAVYCLLPGRVVKNLVMIPIESVCITTMHMLLVQPMTRRGMVPGLH